MALLERGQMSRSTTKRKLKLQKRRPIRRLSSPSGTNKQEQVVEFKVWERNMPQWLKDAKDAIESGRAKEAAELLDEQAIEKNVTDESKRTKMFIQFAAAGLLRQIGQAPRAEILYKEILKSTPNNPSVHNELATVCKFDGRMTEAIQHLNKAMEELPDEPRIWTNLGVDLVHAGQTEKGIALLRKSVEKMSDHPLAYSNLLLYMHYLPDIDTSEIYEESHRWAQINAPAKLAKVNHDNDPNPERKLRIGYISPDFRTHSVSFFLEPLLDGHHRQSIEVYGYGSMEFQDHTTGRLKAKFDHYRNIRSLDDKTAARTIEDDKIDILVDLAGHTANNRLCVMAYKPAPIQVTWLGYPGTTGMSQIDYRLTDSITNPPSSQEFYTEELVFLPDGFLCYGPGKMAPPVAPLSAAQKGTITFGCFNNNCKINPYIIGLWAGILKIVEGSSLLLKFKGGNDEDVRAIYIEQFEKLGISRERLAFSGWLLPPGHLVIHNMVDIALDTYPYNGTTTTCQALLMGVPVISLVGKDHKSRVGLDILSRLGLEFFAASTPQEYVSKATALAAKPEALMKIRSSLRARMAVSPLCNRAIFTANVEHAYRKMWHKWCKSKGVDVPTEEPMPDDQSSRTEALICSSQSTDYSQP